MGKKIGGYMKNRKVLIIVMIVFLVLLAVGITYGVLMFSYTKTGSTNEQLVTGDIYMHYLEKNELVIQNAFSRDSYDPSKYFEFTIDGKNTCFRIFRQSENWPIECSPTPSQFN